MTTSDILYIISTVAVTQAVCDLLANKFVFSSEVYHDRLSSLERARIKRNKAISSPAPNSTSAKAIDKHNRKIKMAEDDYAMAASALSQKHIGPNMASSLVFIMLYRILSFEYSGTVIAVLPYEPWGILRKLSMRGISFEDGYELQSAVNVERIQGVNQACGFLFIYLLCTMSVKFLVHNVLGTKPPKGADKGFMNLLDDPRGQKVLQGLGVDTEEINEMRKVL